MNDPASLFPPTPEKMLAGMQVILEASLTLAQTMAALIITFVGDTFRFVL